MTAFLKAEGMSEVVLSLFRGLGAASGVAATFSFPALQRHLGAVPAPSTPSSLFNGGWCAKRRPASMVSCPDKTLKSLSTD